MGEPCYPVTITRAQLEDLDGLNACEPGIEVFDFVAPTGSLTIGDVHAHAALLAGPLGAFEDWAIAEGLLPPVRMTGGARAVLMGGYRATLTGGDGAVLTGGDYSTLTGGYRATLTGGRRSTLTGGGGYSTLTGGGYSKLTAGYGATLTGGDYSTLTGGYRAALTGGDYSTLLWRLYDGGRYRIVVRYVGDGIEAGVAYRAWWDHEKGEAVVEKVANNNGDTL